MAPTLLTRVLHIGKIITGEPALTAGSPAMLYDRWAMGPGEPMGYTTLTKELTHTPLARNQGRMGIHGLTEPMGHYFFIVRG